MVDGLGLSRAEEEGHVACNELTSITRRTARVMHTFRILHHVVSQRGVACFTDECPYKPAVARSWHRVKKVILPVSCSSVAR